jgi:hypothetical protein
METSPADHCQTTGWMPRRDPALWAILAVYLALAITYSHLFALGYGPDETSRHYPYIQWLADKHVLPPSDPAVDCGPLELHPPLYYAVLLSVYLAAHPYGNVAALRALRWTSPFIILAALLLWFPVIRRACGGRRGPTLFAYALTAWWPNLFVTAGTFSNDAGALLLSALLLYLVAVRHWTDRGPRSAALWGLVLGVGALMKSSALTVGIPVIAVVLIWQHGARCWRDGRFWTRALSAAAACAVTCGWWYVRNLGLYGELIPVPRGYCLIPAALTGLEALMAGMVGPLAMRAVNGLWVSAFAGAVWFPDWTHGVVYPTLRVLTALGVLGVLVGAVRLGRRGARLAPEQGRALVLTCAGFGAIYLSCIWVSVFAHAGVYQGGRYLLIVLPGLTVPLALGLREVCPRPMRGVLAALVLLLFLGLSALVWYHLTTYWNPYVLGTAGRFQ